MVIRLLSTSTLKIVICSEVSCPCTAASSSMNWFNLEAQRQIFRDVDESRDPWAGHLRFSLSLIVKVVNDWRPRNMINTINWKLPAKKIFSKQLEPKIMYLSLFFFQELMGKIIQEMCHPLDLQKLSLHLKETLTLGTATSSVYRLRVGSPDKFVRVKTVSKLFKTNASLQEPDFIMATHSIIGYVTYRVPTWSVKIGSKHRWQQSGCIWLLS